MNAIDYARTKPSRERGARVAYGTVVLINAGGSRCYLETKTKHPDSCDSLKHKQKDMTQKYTEPNKKHPLFPNLPHTHKNINPSAP